MKKWIIPVVILLIALNGVFIYFVAKTAVNEPETSVIATKQIKKQQDKPPTAKELLRLVNIERKKVGVAPLKMNKNMQTTAQWKADDMKNRDYFSHFPKTLDGEPNTKYTVNADMRALLRETCVESSENISWGDQENTSASAMAGWIDSKPHYKAMIDPKYTLTGIAVSGNKIVQHFCIAK